MDEKEAEDPPVMGTIFLIGRAKRAPHWGVQSRFRVIYIYICCRYVVCLMSVVCQINCLGGITWPMRMLKVFWGRLTEKSVHLEMRNLKLTELQRLKNRGKKV